MQRKQVNSMLKKMIAGLTAATVLVFALAAGTVNAAEHTLEISLETGPNHIRNIMVSKIAEEIEAAADGRLEVKIFHGASQYKMRDVPTALAQGALDMGVVGTWVLGNVLSDFHVTGLPMFYGMSRQEQYRAWDGATGKALEARLEKKLGIKIVGRWLDLGFGALFFTKKKVATHADLAGLKMRAPGGAINVARFKVFGSTAVSIPFSDVPQALQRGTVDGMLSTNESVRSAKLWDSGIKYAFNNNIAFYQYIPMMSANAWNKLPQDLQKIVTDTWNAKVDEARDLAAQRQASAVEEARSNGVVHVNATAADTVKVRSTLMAAQDDLVAEMRIDPALVALARKDLGPE